MILEHNNVKDNFIYISCFIDLSNQMSKSHTAIICMEFIIIKKKLFLNFTLSKIGQGQTSIIIYSGIT